MNLFFNERAMVSIRSVVYFGACGLLGVGAACADEAVTPSPVVPYAAIQFVNVVPDTGEMDIRVVDIVSSTGLFDAVFREGDAFPQPIEAGSRRIRTFMSSVTDQTIASDVVLDTVFNFAENGRYLFFLSGYARPSGTPPLAAVITSPALPTVGAGQFAIRVLNLSPSLAGSVRALADTAAAQDAYLMTGSALPGGTPIGTALAYLGSSAYAVVDTGRYHIALTSTGATDPAVVKAMVPLGSASPRVAGSRISGSVLTAIIVPRAAPGSDAPQDSAAQQSTDTSASESSRRMVRSNDTVTVQVGSITRRANRPDSITFDTTFIVDTTVVVDTTTGDTTSITVDTLGMEIEVDTLENRADTTIASTGTGASAGVVRNDIVLVVGAAEPEYNGWQAILAGSGTLGASGVADTLLCNPVAAGDTTTKCATVNALATTRFRFRYRIVGTPASPATGTPVYRLHAPSFTATDYTTPQIIFIVDRRP